MSEEEREKLIKKWSALGFGEGIEPLKNLEESTRVLGELDHPNEFPSLLPIAMKVVAQTLSRDLVSVSPMDPPGMIFKPAIERVKHLWEKYRTNPAHDYRQRIIEDMRRAFKGMSDERINEHIDNPEMMEKLLKVGTAAERFGV